MGVVVDVEESADLVGEIADVLAGPCDGASCGLVGLVGIDQEFHLQGLQVAVDELEKRGAQAGNGHLGEVVVLVDGVLFGVEEDFDVDPGCPGW